MRKLLFIMIWLFHYVLISQSQTLTQTLKGTVTDKETRIPLAGANIIMLNSFPLNGTTTGSDGKFRLTTGLGRVSIKISYLGYEDLIIKDILIASGKEAIVNIELQEKVLQTQEVIINASRDNRSALNQMASISTHTIRTDDALHYAGGF